MSKGNNTKRKDVKRQPAKKQSANKQSADKKPGSNTNLLIVVIAVVLCAAAAVAVVVRKNAGSTQNGGTGENGNITKTGTIAEGESLVISTSDISSTASFYKVNVDGTEMEILAVKDSEGNIRTAFNTCQICYSSGRGYYVQDGSALVCQNCCNRFTVDQIEIKSGGCNPWPIFPENKVVTDDTIEISYDFLKGSREIFANWKAQYS